MKTDTLHYDEASFLSRLFSVWPLPLVKELQNAEITSKMLPEIPQSINFDKQVKELTQHWAEERTQPNPSYLRAMKKTLMWEFIGASMLPVVHQTCMLLRAVEIGYMVEWLKTEDASLSTGLLHLGLFSALGFISFVSLNRCAVLFAFLVGKIKALTSFIISEKLLTVSFDVLNTGNTAGMLTNVLGTDLELLEMVGLTAQLLAVPIQLVFSAVILWLYMDLPGLLGIGVILLHFILLLSLGKMNMTIRLSISSITDQRIHLIKSVVEGIKLIKLYAWERPFLSRAETVRAQEIRRFLRLSALTGFFSLLHLGLSGLSIFVPLWVYIETIGTISVAEAFVAASVLYLASYSAVGMGTLGVRSVFIVNSVFKRVTDVLMLRDHEPSQPSSKTYSGISLVDAAFSWAKSTEKLDESELEKDTLVQDESPSEIALRDVSFSGKPGELIAVVGSVGSGKTTLLVGSLGEAHLRQGTLQITSSVAYVPSTSWVIPDTLQENVVLGRPFDSARYAMALSVSDLTKDVQAMEDRDATVVSEVSLSGGQKARLGLARAVYADAELYLLDDPLSAVDPEVSARIVRHLKKLAQTGKCIIIATHQTQILSYVDQVVLLKNGQQVYFGKLAGAKDCFAELLGDVKECQNSDRGSKDSSVTARELVEQASSYELDDSEMHKNSFSRYTRYLGFAYKSWIMYVFVGLVVLISQIPVVGVYYWVSIWTSSDDQNHGIYPLVFGCIIVAVYVLAGFRYFFVYYTLLRANKHMHNAALDGLVRTNSQFFDKYPAGYLLNRFTKETSMMDEVILNLIADGLNLIMALLGYIIIIVLFSPGALIGLAVYIGLFLYAVKTLLPLSRALRRVEIVSKGPLISTASSTINGLLTIRSLSVQSKFLSAMRQAAMTNFRGLSTYFAILRFLQLVLEFGSLIISIFNAVSLMLMKDLLSPEFAAITLSMTIAIAGLSNMVSRSMVDLDSCMEAPERLNNFTSLPPEPTNNQPINIPEGAIRFKNVCARYAPELPHVLTNINLTIPARAKVGIIGRTGAGKSSMFQLLFRVITPSSGTVFIDGEDYLKAGLQELRLQLGVIPQTPLVFDGTVRQNIDPFGQYSEKEIEDALEKVNLLQFFYDQPRQLDTQLCSDELALSAGQKQLVCMARALIKQTKIVVMDEATANLDNHTDKIIQKMVRKYFTESTLLVIAHRLRTVVDSDLIVVMDSGACAEFGSPAELINNEASIFNKFIQHTGKEEAQHLYRRIAKYNNKC